MYPKSIHNPLCDFVRCVFFFCQSNDFLGRKLAKRLKANHVGSTPAADAAAAEEESGSVEVLGRERRKGGEPVDLEVVDDRELYQHLLKVRVALCAMGLHVLCVVFPLNVFASNHRATPDEQGVSVDLRVGHTTARSLNHSGPSGGAVKSESFVRIVSVCVVVRR